MALLLNFLSAVATVGAKEFTQQSSNIPLMNPLSIPELSLNHLGQIQKMSKNANFGPPLTPNLGTFFDLRGHRSQVKRFQTADLKFGRRKTKLDLQNSVTDFGYKAYMRSYVAPKAKTTSKLRNPPNPPFGPL